MNNGPGAWLLLIITTVGAGAAGSLITTYGGQTRERRRDRFEVLSCLLRMELARQKRPVGHGFDYSDSDMAELTARCLMAGVPLYLVRLYKDANDCRRWLTPSDRMPPNPSANWFEYDESGDMLAYLLTNDAAGLLRLALAHPWLSAVVRRYRGRKLGRQLSLIDRPATDREHKRLTVEYIGRFKRAKNDWFSEEDPCPPTITLERVTDKGVTSE